MDSKIAARCFTVSAPENGAADFQEILLEAIALPTPGERESEVHPGATLRLERCTRVGNTLHGEFCRKQTTNIPPSAGNAGLAPINMATGHGLGHVAAFLYHYPSRTLVLQSNRQCATANRIAVYIGFRSIGSQFNISPIIHPDMLDRIRGKPLRRLRVRFASPENLEVLERSGVAAGRIAREAAEAYGAHTIEITLSANFESRSSTLNARAPGALRRLLGHADVSQLEVKTLDDEGVENVDLIDEKMKFEEVLDLPEGNPDQHYIARRAWLEKNFRAILPTINRLRAQPINGDDS